MFFPVLILVAKYGIAASFNTAFLSHNKIFPVLFAATAMGFCNMFARLFSGFSSLLAAIDEPFPMYMFTGTAAVTAIAVIFLSVPTTEELQRLQESSDGGISDEGDKERDADAE